MDDPPKPFWRTSLPLLAAALVAVFCWPSDVLASPYFKWIDGQGNLHVTDRLADVPEPYYSTYKAILDARKEAGEGGSKAPLPPPVASSTKPPRAEHFADAANNRQETPSQELQRRRKQWRELMQWWRNELRQATEAVEKADLEVATAQQNPVLRHTPQVQVQIDAAQKNRQQAIERFARARKMLLETLPERAKKEGVPPKWLQ